MRIFSTALFLSLTSLAAQNPFTGLEFGTTTAAIPKSAKDVSNKQSWDETAFQVENPNYTLLGKFKPARCTLTYYKKRLTSARCEFSRALFETIFDTFSAARKKPDNAELAKRDKSATWYGPYRDGRFEDTLNVYQLSDVTVVTYSDEKQKDFRFGDLFRGMTPWLILSIVGLFAAYLAFGWLMTSKCPKCKTRKLKITGKSFDNPKDYNPDLFGNADIHWDEVYHYKCAHCGFEKDDRYSGFMNWWRNRDN
ncbi:MAG: hypothetical protein KF713_19085 [Turneriella sp.]|nr:hypothetical protein [Turneriella sp.]